MGNFFAFLTLGSSIPSRFSRPSQRLSAAVGEISESARPGAFHYLISQITCSPMEACHAVKSALARLLPQMLEQNGFHFSHAAEDQLSLCLNEKDAFDHPYLVSTIIKSLSGDCTGNHLAFISSLFLKDRAFPISNTLKNAAYLSFTQYTSQMDSTECSYEKLMTWLRDLGYSETWDDYIWA